MILPFEWQLIASVEIIIVWDDLEKDYGKIKNHYNSDTSVNETVKF
jgi:hypothetical protein